MAAAIGSRRLQGRRLLLLGAGADVAAALPAIAAAGPAVVHLVEGDAAAADRARDELAADGIAVDVAETVDDAPPVDVIVRSPGFPLYRSDVAARVHAGTPTVSPLGMWLVDRGPLPSVGITGTKGKSSTTALVVLGLEHLGVEAIALGNIGVPAWTEPADTAAVPVLEISSYQSADLAVAPPFAVLTAVGDDHLSWHGSVEAYHRDKARVFTAPAATLDRWMGVLGDVALPPAFAGVSFTLVDPPDQPSIRWRNARLAAAACAAVATAVRPQGTPVDVTELTEVLVERYPSLPGRLSSVAELDGVSFVDDALASNPTGVVASVTELTGPITLVVGGESRGVSTEPLIALARSRAQLRFVCIDDAVDLVHVFADAGAPADVAASLEEAVAFARSVTPIGGTVLFSPGMPTPRDQGNWETRSARFRAAVGSSPTTPAAGRDTTA